MKISAIILLAFLAICIWGKPLEEKKTKKKEGGWTPPSKDKWKVKDNDAAWKYLKHYGYIPDTPEFETFSMKEMRKALKKFQVIYFCKNHFFTILFKL